MIRGEILLICGGGKSEVTAFPVVTARSSCRKTPSFRRNKLSPVAGKLFYPQSNLPQAITFPIYFKDAKF
jgi:hypothetical protein